MNIEPKTEPKTEPWSPETLEIHTPNSCNAYLSRLRSRELEDKTVKTSLEKELESAGLQGWGC